MRVWRMVGDSSPVWACCSQRAWTWGCSMIERATASAARVRLLREPALRPEPSGFGLPLARAIVSIPSYFTETSAHEVDGPGVYAEGAWVSTGVVVVAC